VEALEAEALEVVELLEGGDINISLKHLFS